MFECMEQHSYLKKHFHLKKSNVIIKLITTFFPKEVLDQTKFKYRFRQKKEVILGRWQYRSGTNLIFFWWKVGFASHFPAVLTQQHFNARVSFIFPACSIFKPLFGSPSVLLHCASASETPTRAIRATTTQPNSAGCPALRRRNAEKVWIPSPEDPDTKTRL